MGSLAAVVLSPLVGGTPGLVMVIAGLIGFGIGVGIVYAATLYYTMEVGSAQVEASGMFETLIGIGYVLGPLCGLAGSSAVAWGGASTAAGEWITLAMVGAMSVIGLAIARQRAIK